MTMYGNKVRLALTGTLMFWQQEIAEIFYINNAHVATPPAKPAPAAPTSAVVAITFIDLRGEVAVIGNRGTKEVDLAGWTLVSETGNQRFVFPQCTVLPAWGSLKVVSGPSAVTGPGMLLWTRGNILNNDGDPVALYDTVGGVD